MVGFGMGLPSLFASTTRDWLSRQTINDCYYIIMSSLGNLQTISEAKANIYAQYLHI